MKRLAIIVLATMSICLLVTTATLGGALQEQKAEWVHTIECDGTRVTLHDMSMREAASWGVDHCENMTVLP